MWHGNRPLGRRHERNGVRQQPTWATWPGESVLNPLRGSLGETESVPPNADPLAELPQSGKALGDLAPAVAARAPDAAGEALCQANARALHAPAMVPTDGARYKAPRPALGTNTQKSLGTLISPQFTLHFVQLDRAKAGQLEYPARFNSALFKPAFPTLLRQVRVPSSQVCCCAVRRTMQATRPLARSAMDSRGIAVKKHQNPKPDAGNEVPVLWTTPPGEAGQ